MQSIYNIAEICAQKGMRDVILSPGSRCAPLTLAFARHPSIAIRTISDERSAAFIAIGISQQTKKTICLVCTSGSAAYNYAPAVAEAFYQQIPLLILTADRPPEWIDQLDGQTIRQNNIYGSHVKASYSLPVDRSHSDAKWFIERTLSEAINLTQTFPKGPVHINIPLREPLYPESEISFDTNVKIIHQVDNESKLSDRVWNTLLEDFKKSEKVLIVAGQSDPDPATFNSLTSFSAKNETPVVADIISNLNHENTIQCHDVLLSTKNEGLLQQLSPDLLITFGKSVISKNLKQFLRKHQPSRHWHIQPSGIAPDTFKSLTSVLSVHPGYFFHTLNEKLSPDSKKSNFFTLWKNEEEKAKNKLKDFFQNEISFNEFSSIQKIIKSLPDNSILHLSNSMPVRYANYLGITLNNIEVYCNRGTSGIDGVISTAFGAAVSTEKMVTVITGDMAFFYDRNALWNNYVPSNLRIIILNNHGGGIFRIIDGPNKQPELEEYFETKQKLIAENTAKDYNLNYALCKAEKDLEKYLERFFSANPNSGILEIETNSKTNTEVFNKFKKSIS